MRYISTPQIRANLYERLLATKEDNRNKVCLKTHVELCGHFSELRVITWVFTASLESVLRGTSPLLTSQCFGTVKNSTQESKRISCLPDCLDNDMESLNSWFICATGRPREKMSMQTIMNDSLRNYLFSRENPRNLRMREPAVDVKTKVSCRVIQCSLFAVLSYSAVVV